MQEVDSIGNAAGSAEFAPNLVDQHPLLLAIDLKRGTYGAQVKPLILALMKEGRQILWKTGTTEAGSWEQKRTAYPRICTEAMPDVLDLGSDPLAESGQRSSAG